MAKTNDVVIMAVGDIHAERQDPLSIFRFVAPAFKQADILLGNQETPITDRGQPIPGKTEIGSVHMRSCPQTAAALKQAGFTAMGFASNHSMDWGPDGLMQTIELLDKAGVAHAGGGRNIAEAHKPAVVTHSGLRVAMLAYTSVYLPVGFAAGESTPGIASLKVNTSYQAPDNILYQPGYPAITVTTPDPAEAEMVLSDIRQAKGKADIVVASFHWGVSFGYGRVVGYQKEMGRAAIDAGADLVIGHHPHRLLGMEMYKGKLICYSLGNFTIDAIKAGHFAPETVILKVGVNNGKINRLSFIAADINDHFEPELSDPKSRLDLMEKLSQEFGTVFSIEGSEVVISGPKAGTPPAQRGMSILADSMLPLPYKKGQKLFWRP